MAAPVEKPEGIVRTHPAGPVWAAAAACLLVAGLAAALGKLAPGAALVATAAALLAVPLVPGPARRRSRLLRARPGRLLPGALDGLAAALVVLPAFFAAAWGLGWLTPADLSPGRIAGRAPQELLLVAIPEEFFFRAWLQGSLRLLGGPRVRLLGARVGLEVPVAAALFALAHLATRPRPDALLVFFPGLIFGWLYARRGSLAGPVLFHAACNLVWTGFAAAG